MKKQTHIRITAILLTATFFSMGAALRGANNLTEKIRKATVKIVTVYIRPDYNAPWKVSKPKSKAGTGVIIEKNLILTNAHIVSDATTIQVQRENDPAIYRARVFRIGHECDLALLKVEKSSFFQGTHSLTFGGLPELQSRVGTYGFPTGGERISITEGVVSRIEIGNYVHSGRSNFLRIQTDAALNPGNSGGPVIQNGRIVGIAFQSQSGSDNIGYMIPVPIIKHFLVDVRDGRFNGFPTLGIFSQKLMHKSHREYLKMPKNETGVIITHVFKGGSASGVLRPGDIITGIDTYNVACDGSILYGNGRLNYSYLISLKQIGQKATVHFIRNGRKKTAALKLKIFPERIHTFNEYETRPDYYIFGGIIFQALSREYMKTWKKWWYNANQRIRYYFMYYLNDAIYPRRKEFVVLNHVLPDRANTYVSNIRDRVVRKINGIPIRRLSDLPRAFKKPIGKYHIIKIDGTPYPIILKANQMADANRRIIKNYQIPSLIKFSKKRKMQ